MSRPKSKDGAERVSMTLPKTMKRWLFKNGGPSFAIRKLIGEKMDAEKSE